MLGPSRVRRGVLLGVVQRGLVAMVAVGDDELFVGHCRSEQTNCGRIADAPDAVQDAVLVGHFGVGRAGALVEDLFHAAGWVGVEHEDLAKVGVRGLQQVQAVALGLGKRLLVAEDDLVGVVVKFAESDESAALFDLVGSRNPEALGVGEDAGILLLDKDALLAARL